MEDKGSMDTNDKPHIVLIIARGEAVRKFIYSDTLKELQKTAKITLLSVIADDSFLQKYGSHVEEVIPLPGYSEQWIVRYLREIINYAHYRWIWTEKVKNKWETLKFEANTFKQKIRLVVLQAIAFLFANRPALKLLTQLENYLSLALKPTEDFDELFARLKPDLVFNTSHIHAARGDLPARVAHAMGIPTAAFVFSWDNLTTRPRILPPYDYYLVWHQQMQEQLLALYDDVSANQVFITGTPQFDFHFKPEFQLSREELSSKMGFDPNRPYVLYTTGMSSDFPDEYLHLEKVIDHLGKYPEQERPQLVVRMYIKGVGAEMEALSQKGIADVYFPPILWEEKWFTPQYEDLSIYTSLLKHAALGINPASTVSLELMMFGKPVINIGFDPPGSDLPHCYRWKRHIDFDHYNPVAESEATMAAYSVSEMEEMIDAALREPEQNIEPGKGFLKKMFGNTLDGDAGKRVAEVLSQLALAEKKID